MPIGPSRRPDEPLHAGWMLLALVLAATLGGASGLIWHWIAGDDLPVAEDAASTAPEEAEEAEAPEPAETVTPPAPSPNAG
ncbi:hypothetical protein [Tsuneonella sp. HG222]